MVSSPGPAAGIVVGCATYTIDIDSPPGIVHHWIIVVGGVDGSGVVVGRVIGVSVGRIPVVVIIDGI